MTDDGNDEDEDREVLCCLNEYSPTCNELGVNAVEEDGQYEKHSMLMDSGSASSFIKRGVWEHLPMEEASESESKRTWTNASGGKVRMKATTRVAFETNNWMPKAVRLKRSEEVDKTIGSVSEFCDKDNTVIFTKSGGAIVHDPGEELAQRLVAASSRSTSFKRERGTYTLDKWIKKPVQANKLRKQNQQLTKEKESIEAANAVEEAMDIAAVPAEEWELWKKTFKPSVFARRHP